MSIPDAIMYVSSSMQAVLAKMALDQLIMAPIFLVLFFFATKTLEGQPHKLMETLREKYLKTVLYGYIIWPLAHIINFKFVPNDLRILYVNVVQVRSSMQHSYFLEPSIEIALMGFWGVTTENCTNAQATQHHTKLYNPGAGGLECGAVSSEQHKPCAAA